MKQTDLERLAKTVSMSDELIWTIDRLISLSISYGVPTTDSTIIQSRRVVKKAKEGRDDDHKNE